MKGIIIEKVRYVKIELLPSERAVNLFFEYSGVLYFSKAKIEKEDGLMSWLIDVPKNYYNKKLSLKLDYGLYCKLSGILDSEASYYYNRGYFWG